MTERSNTYLLLLEISTCCVFAGRAWQHLFWDAPYRELLWDPSWMKWIVLTLTQFSWEEYVTHPMGDIWFQRGSSALGIFYLVCAVAAFFVKKFPALRWLMYLGAALLVLLAFVYLKDHFYHLGQFFEYTLQFSSPLFLVAVVRNNGISPWLERWMKIAIALTFACHGLYAIAFYPRPAIYSEMTIRILQIDNAGAATFLSTAGFLDFLVAVGIFLPRPFARIFLAYAVFWGLATTLARIVGNFYWEFPWLSLHQWVHESVYRVPHFLIPLLLFLRTLYQPSLSTRYRRISTTEV